jgi:Helix-turn-helix domain
VTPATAASAPDGLPVYLTAAEVAKMLRVSEKSIYRWASDDPSMPILRIGGKKPTKRGTLRGTVLFPKERLIRWLQDREQGAPRTRRHVLSAAKSAPGKESDDA